MKGESRMKKSLLNARVSLFFYFVFIVISFFSRKIFLDCLGADFVGLSGTLSNILGFLSLAELGVGAAVSYNLYKPIEQNNRQTIEELISVFGYLYRWIGIVVLLVGIIISFFIPVIFRHTIFSYELVFFAFYSILGSSLLSYFVNYRQILLTADQKGYVVTAYLQGAGMVKALLQMFFAYEWGNYYVWILLEFVFSFLGCVILNWKIARAYPWLKASVAEGKQVFPRFHYLLRFTRKVFVHKIKDFLLFRSDEILVFAFISLKMVAYYGNYTLVVNRVSQAFDSALNSFQAGVGNLVAEGDRSKSLRVFWELVSVRFIVAGFLIFPVYNLIEPFISLWLGPQYILDHTILVLMMINVLIAQTRGAVDMFNTAFGHYADTWAAWAEFGLNLFVTFATAPFLGIAGILLGKIASTFIIIIIWKPFYLFRVGFRKKMKVYWKYELRYYVIILTSISFCSWLFQLMPINAAADFVSWAMKAVVMMPLFTAVYLGCLYAFTPGTRDLMYRLRIMVLNGKEK